jgi:hypothetical protein
MAECEKLWRNVGSYYGGMSRVIMGKCLELLWRNGKSYMAECQELFWRNVRSYGEMSGITMAECQALLWRNVRSYGGMSRAMQECHELWWNVKSY